MSTSIKDSLLYEVAPPVASSANKVTVVGVGMVGMACAFSILTQVIYETYVKVELIFY